MRETILLARLQRPVFGALGELYATHGGETEREVDFGMHWIVDEGVSWPKWRVSHVQAPEDFVYAVRMGRPDTAVLIAKSVSLSETEYALSGWADRNAPTLAWAVRQLGSADPSYASTVPVFEEDTSALTVSNDGRVVSTVAGQEVGSYGIAVDGVVVWRTKNRVLVDAFIAGWDARSETVT